MAADGSASTLHGDLGDAALGPLDSRYIDVAALDWQPTSSPGIEVKVLYSDDSRGLKTALFRWAPGSELEVHEHMDIEQTYILEGSLVDDEGEATAGNFVWRPKGSRHVARSPHGALMLAIFLEPNRFFGDRDNQSVGT